MNIADVVESVRKYKGIFSIYIYDKDFYCNIEKYIGKEIVIPIKEKMKEMSTKLKARGKYLSYILRHRPEDLGIKLDKQGWTDVEYLLERMNETDRDLTLEELNDLVENNSKKRYSFSEDRTQIRAVQGHSVEVDLGYDPIEPPSVLYHGTPEKFVDSILESGITKQSRTQVHLSSDIPTATEVARRRGKAVILKVQAREMHEQGYTFYQSDNGVWLTEVVPKEYITI